MSWGTIWGLWYAKWIVAVEIWVYHTGLCMRLARLMMINLLEVVFLGCSVVSSGPGVLWVSLGKFMTRSQTQGRILTPQLS